MAIATQADTVAQSATDGSASDVEQKGQSGCCGGPAPQGTDACCALDAEVKTAGGSGCGCAPKAAKKGCC